MNKKTWLTIFAMIGVVIYLGYGTKSDIVVQCKSEVSTYVTAEYSETSVGIDMDGGISTDTDYWSEPASDRFWAITINGELDETNIDVADLFEHHQSFYPPMPMRDRSMKQDANFNSFREHKDTKLVMIMGETQFKEPISKTSECINMIGETIDIKTWYSISYGF